MSMDTTTTADAATTAAATTTTTNTTTTEDVVMTNEEQEEEEKNDNEDEEEENPECVLCSGRMINDDEDDDYFGYLGQVGCLDAIRIDKKYAIPPTTETTDKDYQFFNLQKQTGSLRICGHYLHQKCYEEYRRDLAPVHYGQYYESRIEYPCPLCKSVSNVLIPVNYKKK